MRRVMPIDDEPPARRGLRHLLLAHPDVDVVGEARREMACISPDAISLAGEMSDGLSLDLLGAPRMRAQRRQRSG